MLQRLIVAAVVVLIAPSLARGAELRLSSQGSIEYDSNIRRSSSNAEQDAVFRISQKMRISDQGSGYDYYVEYRLPYQVSLRTDELSDLNHFGAIGGKYRLGPTTFLTTRNNFAFINAASNEQIDLGGGAIRIDSRDEIISRLNGGASLSHALTRRIQGRANFLYSYFDSTDSDRREVNTVGGVVSLNYAVDAKNRVGFGVDVVRQAFADLSGANLMTAPQKFGSQTLTYRGFLSWVLRFDDSLSFSARGGPTYLSTTQNGSSAQSDLLTFFGTASLSKRWSPRVNSSINYRRTQSDASGLGGTTILDAAGLSLGWRISQLWSSSLRFDWTQRESVSTFAQKVATRRWAVAARVARKLSPRLKTTLRLSFNRQISENRTAGTSSDFDSFGAILGFSYLFDPIAIW